MTDHQPPAPGHDEIIVTAPPPGTVCNRRQHARLGVLAEVVVTFGDTTSGAITLFTSPKIGGTADITAGPDGALWFTNYAPPPGIPASIGRITTTGQVTNFTTPFALSAPSDITPGPGRTLWFTSIYAQIGQIAGL